MEGTVYLSYSDVLNVYKKTIDKSGGGFSGIRDKGGIAAILSFVQNDIYYPTFEDKLSYLVYRFCTGHFFDDGNKRIALTVVVAFLLNNGYIFIARSFMQEMEAIILHVAAGKIKEDLLKQIICCIVEQKDYSESLKLDIIHAISDE